MDQGTLAVSVGVRVVEWAKDGAVSESFLSYYPGFTKYEIDFLATTIRSNKVYSDYAMGAWAANRVTGIRNYIYSTVSMNYRTFGDSCMILTPFLHVL